MEGARETAAPRPTYPAGQNLVEPPRILAAASWSTGPAPPHQGCNYVEEAHKRLDMIFANFRAKLYQHLAQPSSPATREVKERGTGQRQIKSTPHPRAPATRADGQSGLTRDRGLTLKHHTSRKRTLRHQRPGSLQEPPTKGVTGKEQQGGTPSGKAKIINAAEAPTPCSYSEGTPKSTTKRIWKSAETSATAWHKKRAAQQGAKCLHYPLFKQT
ncbi:Hypothetical predicted protein [Pelobates cultripes]|uniref:Uncharacterized protein n=1 Tax=Pelobates cultripes TaxID=61616 RepID=A0AAD1RMU9_PELCU|nr:Hypothetical predicted protein [Pelobates cultripes]